MKVETLRVVLEASSDKMRKELRRAKSEAGTYTKAVDSSVKQASRQMEAAAEPVKSVVNSVKQVAHGIREADSQINMMGPAEQVKMITSAFRDATKMIREYATQAQLDAGIREYSESYLQLQEDIEDAEKKIDSLQKKADSFSESDKYQLSEPYKQLEKDITKAEKALSDLQDKLAGFSDADKYQISEPYKQLEKNIAGVEKKLEKLNQKKASMEQSGKAFLSTTEYEQTASQVDKTRNKLDELIAKRKQLMDERADWGFGDRAIPRSLDEDIETTKSALASLENQLQAMRAEGDNQIPTEGYELITEEIEKAEEKLRQFQEQSEQMKAAGEDKVLSKSYEQLTTKIQNAEARIAGFREQKQQMEADGSNLTETNRWKEVQRGIEEATSRLQLYQETAAEQVASGEYTQSTTKGFSSDSYIEAAATTASSAARSALKSVGPAVAEVRNRIAAVIKQVPVLGRVVTESSYVAKKGFSLLTDGIKRSGGAAASLIKRFASGIPILNRFTGGIKNNTNGVNQNNASLGNGVKTLLKYGLGIRSLYALVNKLRSALVDGFKNLVQFSSTTNANLSLLSSQLLQLKNSLATAFEPILTAITPILSQLIDYVISATNAVAQLFAALSGSSTYTVAKRVAKDYAADLADTSDSASEANKSAKELKKTLMGFDEINKLDDTSSNSNSGNSGSGGISADDMFATETVSNDFAELASSVKDVLKTLFDPMKEAWDKNGASVISAWKSALGSIKTLIGDIGKSFLEVWSNGTGEQFCSNILKLLGDIGKAVDVFADSLDKAWNKGGTGTKLLQSWFDKWNAILGLIDTVANSMLTVWGNGTGESILSNILMIFTNINTAIGNIASNFEKAWKKADTGTGIVQGIADIANTLLGHINNITKNFKDWTSTLDFSPLLKAFKNLVDAVKPLADKVGEGLEWFLKNVAQPLAKWALESIIPSTIEAISGALKVLDAVIDVAKPTFTWLWDNFLKPLATWTGGAVGEIIQDIADALDDLAEAIKEIQKSDVYKFLFGENDKSHGGISGGISVDVNANYTTSTDGLSEEDKTIPTKAGFSTAKDEIPTNQKSVSGFGAVVQSVKDQIIDRMLPGFSGSLVKAVDHIPEKQKSIGTIASFFEAKDEIPENGKIVGGITANFASIKDSLGSKKTFDTTANFSQRTDNLGTLKSFVTTANFKEIVDNLKDKKTFSTKANFKEYSDGLGKMGNRLIGMKANYTDYSVGLGKMNNRLISMKANYTDYSVGLGKMDKRLISMKANFSKFQNAIPVKNRALDFKANITGVTGAITGGIAGTFSVAKKAEGGIYKNGRWQPVRGFAGGGNPQTAQVFMARENGMAELVGRIGNATTVMNNDQIVASVASGVANAIGPAVYTAMVSAMQSNGGESGVRIVLEGDAKGLFRIVRKEAINYTSAHGEPAFPV